MSEVQLKNITKEYDNGFVAVKDFNLDVSTKLPLLLSTPVLSMVSVRALKSEPVGT